MENKSVLKEDIILSKVSAAEKVPVTCFQIPLKQGPRKMLAATNDRIYDFFDRKQIFFEGTEELDRKFDFEEFKCTGPSDKLDSAFIIVKTVLKFTDQNSRYYPEFLYWQTFLYRRAIFPDLDRFEIREIKNMEEVKAAQAAAAGQAESAPGEAESAQGQANSAPGLVAKVRGLVEKAKVQVESAKGQEGSATGPAEAATGPTEAATGS